MKEFIYLDKHLDFLNELKGVEDNIAIGGSTALKMHGLKLKQDPSDLDIIVFTPSERQRELIINQLNSDSELYFLEEEEIKNPTHSYSKTIDSCRLNVIIERDIEIEPELLQVYFFGWWRINSVYRILDAKRNYGRTKDLNQLDVLNKLNFGYSTI